MSDFETQVKAFNKTADATSKTVLGWWDDIPKFDAATIQSRATRIIEGWAKLQLAHCTLAAGATAAIANTATTPTPSATDDGATADAPAAADPRRETAAINDDLDHAGSRVAGIRKQIGIVVGLQDFKEYAVLGSYKVHDPGVNPTVFIESQVQRTLRAYGVIFGIGTVVDRAKESTVSHPNGRPLDFNEQKKVINLMKSTRSDLEYQFVMAALTHLGYAKHVYGMEHMASVVAHHDNLQRSDAASRDDVSPERAAAMQKDVATISREVHSTIYSSNDKVDEILDKWDNDPHEHNVFLRLLERENLVDAMMVRGNASRVARFAGREYEPSNYAPRGLYDAVTEVGEEGGRQTPGALCHFMAGVYDGMSSLPLIGDTMGDAAAAFRDLSKELDHLTGASKDGIEARNRIASASGMTVQQLGMIGIQRQLGASGVAASAGADVASATADAAAWVERFSDFYDSAGVAWQIAFDTFPALFKGVADGVSLCRAGADAGPIAFDLGLTMVDAWMEGGIKAAKTAMKGRFTAAGRAKANRTSLDKKTDAANDEHRLLSGLPAEVQQAVDDLRKAQRAQTKAKTEDEQWAAAIAISNASQKVNQAFDAMDPDVLAGIAADGKRRNDLAAKRGKDADVERERKKMGAGGDLADGTVSDVFNTVMIDALAGMLSAIKSELISALKDMNEQRRGAPKLPADGKDDGTKGFDIDESKLAAECTKAGVSAVTKLVTPAIEAAGADIIVMVGKRLSARYPALAGAAELAREPAKELMAVALEDFPLMKMLDDDLPDRVAEMITGKAPEKKD